MKNKKIRKEEKKKKKKEEEKKEVESSNTIDQLSDDNVRDTIAAKR